MTVERIGPSNTAMDVIEVRTKYNFLEVQAASKYDGTVHITSWLNGTNLHDSKSYNPVNPKEHKGIGVRVSQEDLPALIEFLQSQVKPLPLLPTAAGSVVEARSNAGRGERGNYRRWVLMDNRTWSSTDNRQWARGEYLYEVDILFDAGSKQ